jgi:hypothetical protein
MNPWICATLICTAGAAGGLVNALISQNGFALPRRIEGIWCPGAVSTIVAEPLRHSHHGRFTVREPLSMSQMPPHGHTCKCPLSLVHFLSAW